MDEALRLSLAGRLLRRPRWLAGTALGVLGWPLQAAALALAPLTVVQPALAFGLVVLLLMGARVLHERVGVREACAVAAIAGGVALLAVAAPDHSTRHASTAAMSIALIILALPAVLPYAMRRWRTPGGVEAAIAAGAGFAWSGLSTKFAVDAASAGAWVHALIWAAVTGAASGLAMLSEMTALQRRPATQTAPLVFVVQVCVPVLAAPLLTGERWSGTPLGGVVIVAGLAMVAGAAVLLIRSPALRPFVDVDDTTEPSGAAVRPRAESSRSSRAATAPGSADGAKLATTMSPADTE